MAEAVEGGGISVTNMVRDEIYLKILVWELYHPGREDNGARNSG